MENELKPCPFCGRSNMRVIDCSTRVTPDDWAIECECGLAVIANNSYKTIGKDKIIDLWNRRAVDAVEVVRCRECAFWGLEPKEGRAEAMCLDLMRTTTSGFYCAHGQRREDGDA